MTERGANLVDLDVALELLLQSLDGLATLSDHATDHALGTLQGTRHASTIL